MNISHFGNEYSSRLWFTIYKKKRIETKIHPRPREILREIATTIIRKKYSPGSRRREGFRKRKTTLVDEIDARKRNTARRPWRFQIYHTARSREVKPWSSRISSQDLPVRSFVPTYSRCNSKRGYCVANAVVPPRSRAAIYCWWQVIPTADNRATSVRPPTDPHNKYGYPVGD